MTKRRASHRAGAAQIPSRERILDFLREQAVPMRIEALAAALEVHGAAATEAFAGRVAAMERDAQLMTNRKGQLCVVAKLDLVTGTVQGHPDGYGFLVPDDGGADLFLSPKEMNRPAFLSWSSARRGSGGRRMSWCSARSPTRWSWQYTTPNSAAW